MPKSRSHSFDSSGDLRVNYTASGRGFSHPIVVDAGHPLLSFAIARRAAEAGTPELDLAEAAVRERFRSTDIAPTDAPAPALPVDGSLVTAVSSTLMPTAAPAVAVHIAVDRRWRRDDGQSVVVRVWQPLATLSQN